MANKMKLYEYNLKCTGSITGMNKEEAKKALIDWLNTYCRDFEISNFKEVGEAW